MGSITVVNLTNSPLQSAITNTGNIYSGINGLRPNTYYHHNALNGTGYDVWERWYVPRVTKDFPHSELSKIGWYVGGAIITALGIIGVALSAGTLAPALAAAEVAFTTAVVAGEAAGATAAVAATAAGILAVDTFLATLGAAEAAGLAVGALVGLTGTGIAVGSPIADYIASLPEASVGPVWGQNNRILSFTGEFPADTSLEKDSTGKTIVVTKIPKGLTAETASAPHYNEDLTPQQFDMMRRQGVLYQIKYRDGKPIDLTQGLVRTNLRGGGGKEKKVTHNGVKVDISRIYKIFLQASPDAAALSCLRAGQDEDDDKVYLTSGNENQELSCCYWQFIPTREKGADGKGGWIIVDRNNVRALCWSDNAIRQYPSEELGIEIVDGWATNVKRSGMVWNLSSFNGSSHQGSIEQPGTDRICVTAHTNDGSQIDGISFNNQNTLQKWVIEVVDDGSDFKNRMGLKGTVFVQDLGKLPLENDKFAGTRGQDRRLEAFYIRILPTIPHLKLEYMAHLADFGDTDWFPEGVTVGTVDQSRRLEGFAIRLTGTDAAKYRISYMAHLEDVGDTNFYHDGEFCGTRGQKRRVEGIQVHLEKL